MVRGCHNTAKCGGRGSQRTQQRVDHSLSYTMKKKKRFDKCRMSSFYHHTKNRPKRVNLAFQVLGRGVGLGTAGLEERGLGFHLLAQSGPWSALRRWSLDPTPTPTRSWWSSPVAKGRHHRRHEGVRAGGERRAFASRDLSRRGVGEDR